MYRSYNWVYCVTLLEKISWRPFFRFSRPHFPCPQSLLRFFSIDIFFKKIPLQTRNALLTRPIHLLKSDSIFGIFFAFLHWEMLIDSQLVHFTDQIMKMNFLSAYNQPAYVTITFINYTTSQYVIATFKSYLSDHERNRN